MVKNIQTKVNRIIHGVIHIDEQGNIVRDPMSYRDLRGQKSS